MDWFNGSETLPYQYVLAHWVLNHNQLVCTGLLGHKPIPHQYVMVLLGGFLDIVCKWAGGNIICPLITPEISTSANHSNKLSANRSMKLTQDKNNSQ